MENSGAETVLAIALLLQSVFVNTTPKEERSYYEGKDFLDFRNSSEHFVGNNHILNI